MANARDYINHNRVSESSETDVIIEHGERISALEEQIAILEQQKPMTDNIGNKYRQEILDDGTMHLVLTESYNGELYE